MTDFYTQLTYDEYKNLEQQIQNYRQHETVHTTVEGYYHKAFRLKVGSVLFEFQGPVVKAPKDG